MATAFAWDAHDVISAAPALSTVLKVMHDNVHLGSDTLTRRMEPYCALSD